MSSSKNFNRVPTRVPKKEDVAKPPFYANFLNVNKIRFPSPALFFFPKIGALRRVILFSGYGTLRYPHLTSKDCL